LTDVALGVIGYVDEQAAERGGELLFAYEARRGRIGGGQGAHTCSAAGEGGVEFGEKLVVSGVRIQLRLELCELRFVEWRTLGVGEQAVDAAGDMAEMEGNGREALGTFV